MTPEILQPLVIEKVKKKVRGKPFVKGVYTGGPGRPPGCKDKKWASIQYWFEKIELDFYSLEPRDRVKIAIDVFLALLARKQLPPETPEESVENAKKLQEELNAIANGSRTEAVAGSSPVCLDDRATGIQVPVNSVEVH